MPLKAFSINLLIKSYFNLGRTERDEAPVLQVLGNGRPQVGIADGLLQVCPNFVRRTRGSGVILVMVKRSVCL